MVFFRFPSLFRLACLAILLLAGAGASAQEVETLLPGQVPRLTRSGGTIYRCLFDPACDALDSDGWPDHWSRKVGVDKTTDRNILFPDYLEIGIVENSNPFSNYSLRMTIRGGGAAAFSPKIPVRPGMSYATSAFVSTENLIHSDVSILVSFYGDEGAPPLKSVVSEKLRTTRGWRSLDIGPLVADMPGVKSISVGLLVMPGTQNDFQGVVDFTNLEIRESPTISLAMADENHLFYTPRDLEVQCRITGIDPDQSAVDFLLEDPFGRVIAMRKADVLIGSRPASQFNVSSDDFESVFVGTATWDALPLALPGFYRVRVATPDSFVRSLNLPPGVFFEDPFENTPPLTFAVLAAQGSFLPDGEFGWSLDGWSVDEITRRLKLLRQSGISRLKLPVWPPDNAPPESRRALNDLCDLLARQQVHLVALLAPLPKSVREAVRFAPVNARSIFSLEPTVWSKSLQPTLQDLSLLVKDWQWTSDDDLSLAEMPGFERQFPRLKAAFDRNDFGLGVGLAWDWNRELPRRLETSDNAADSEVPVAGNSAAGREFVALASSDSLTPDDLEAYLAASSDSAVRRFVSLTPLSPDYELSERIGDLVRRMVIAKDAGAEAVFLTKPVDDQVGLFRSNLTPGELLLPWRTTATLLSGRRSLGSVGLPRGSRNFHFDVGGGQAVMVLWNDRASPDRPVEEILYLGEQIELIDVWGNRFQPERRGREQVIPAGPVPLFVTGLDADIVRFRHGFQLGATKIPSFPNRENRVPFTLRNDTASPVSAQVSVLEPKPGSWTVAPDTQTLSPTPGEASDGEFRLTLSNTANYGRQPFRVRVRTRGSVDRDFVVYDELFVGDPDVFMEFSSRTTPGGDIELTQAFVNDGEKSYTYSCRLYVPGRPYLPSFVRGRGFGRWETVYTIPGAAELLESGPVEATLRATPVTGASPETQPMVYSFPLQDDPSP